MPEITVNPRRCRGIYYLIELGIHYPEFAHKFIMALQPVFLMVIFGKMELCVGNYLGIYFLFAARFFALFASQSQLLLFFVVIENDGGVLPRPGAVGRVMILPKSM